MSLLLKSLKKAEKAPPPTEDLPPDAATDAGAETAAEAAATATDAGSKASPTATAKDELRKKLVIASRIFKASGDGADRSRQKKMILGLLMVLAVAGMFLLLSGIPGLNISALFSSPPPPAPAIRAPAPTPEPVTETAEKAEVDLPIPAIDIQSEVEEAAARENQDGLLDTPERQRDFARQISEPDEPLADIAPALPSAADAIADLGTIENQADAETEAILSGSDVKTAEASRNRKQELDERTPSDSVLIESIQSNDAVPFSESLAAIADAEILPPAEDGGEPVSEDEAPAEDASVSPAAAAQERSKLLADAAQLYADRDYSRAESIYSSIAEQHPTNLRALRGVALVAVATGRQQAAAGAYRQILRHYPNDPVALAGLANLQSASGGNFNEMERLLKNALGAQPALDGRLHYALGNIYADQKRWADARNSYFKAHAHSPGNPDYAYNLAVVLDYLNRPAQAARFYKEALRLSARGPAGFDRRAAEKRIQALEQ